jgi:hypothetical protein
MTKVTIKDYQIKNIDDFSTFLSTLNTSLGQSVSTHFNNIKQNVNSLSVSQYLSIANQIIDLLTNSTAKEKSAIVNYFASRGVSVTF